MKINGRIASVALCILMPAVISYLFARNASIFQSGSSAPIARMPKVDGLEETVVKGVFVDDSIIDLGSIAFDDKVTETYHVTNRNDVPISIQHIEKSCDCMEIGQVDSVIPPHATISIPVLLDASKINENNFQRSVEVSILGFENRLILYMTGQLERTRQLRILPACLEVEAVRNSIAERDIFIEGDIKSLEALPADITLQGSAPIFVDLPEPQQTPRTVVRKLRVKCLGSDDWNGSLILRVGGSRPRQAEIPVHFTISAALVSGPSRLYMTGMSAELVISRRDGNKLKDLRVSTTLPLAFTINKMENGVIGISIQRNPGTGGLETGEVKVTDVAIGDTIKIPVVLTE